MEMPVKPHPRFAFARLRALFTDPPRRRRGGLKRAAGRWSALVLSAWTAASCGRAPTADAEPAGTPPPEPPPAPQRRVLKTTIPGRWYPDDAAALGAQMRALLEAAPATDAPPDVIALILPHAGFQFSGSTAAAGLKAAGKCAACTQGGECAPCRCLHGHAGIGGALASAAELPVAVQACG